MPPTALLATLCLLLCRPSDSALPPAGVVVQYPADPYQSKQTSYDARDDVPLYPVYNAPTPLPDTTNDSVDIVHSVSYKFNQPSTSYDSYDVDNTYYPPPKPHTAKPMSSYSPPSTSYGAPSKQYGAPSTKYGVPSTNYGVPSTTYGVPSYTYGPPTSTYGAPAPTYGAPAPAYGAPAPTYGAPAPAYGPPVTPHPKPMSTYGPPRGMMAGIPIHTILKIVLKVVLFKMIVKFIAVICLLLFVPKFDLSHGHKDDEDENDDEMRKFGSNERLDALTTSVWRGIDAVQCDADASCQLARRARDVDEEYTIMRLFRLFLREYFGDGDPIKPILETYFHNM